MGTISGREGDQHDPVLESSPAPSFFDSLTEFFDDSARKATPATGDSSALLEVVGCVPTAATFALSQSLAQGMSRPILVLLENPREAFACYQDLQFYCFGQRSVRIFYYPEADISPYVASSPPLSLTAQRLECLYHLSQFPSEPLEHLVIVTSLRAVMERVIDPDTLQQGTLIFKLGKEFSRETVINHLTEVGYIRSNLVEDRGNFSIRGSLLDIFPPLLKHPVRLEFFGDELESIRSFSADTQRTLAQKSESATDKVICLPVKEMFFDDVSIRRVEKEMKLRMDDLGIPKLERERLTEMIRQRIYFPGIEHYLPLFRKNLVALTHYLAGRSSVAVIFRPPKLVSAYKDFQEEIARCFSEARTEVHPTSIIDPEERFLITGKNQPPFFLPQEGSAFSRSLHFEDVEVLAASGKEDVEKPKSVRALSRDHAELRRKMAEAKKGVGAPLKPLVDYLRFCHSQKYRTFIVCGLKSHSRRLLEMLNQHEVPVNLVSETEEVIQRGFTLASEELTKAHLLVGNLRGGFSLPGEGLVLLTEEEIFGPRVKRARLTDNREPGTNDALALITSFSELREGDYVVHLDFGIARYQGLVRLDIAGVANDFLHLEYKEGDRLYLPIHRLSRIQKYVGGEAAALTLNRLGNKTHWEKTKEKVERRIKEAAKELLELYASRQVAKGLSFGRPNEYYREFEAEFPFEETPDQLKAIDDVLGDMADEKCMDRLICGDVGYGKTEVAIRALFLAAMQGYQSALLAPTTVLVHQHFRNLKKRFSGYPIEVGMLSRFATRTEIQETLAGLKEGTIDVVVGTHRLLSPDVQYKKLGLLVIDEEQRFGVRHKERIKLFRKNLDVITLSATPIPRTLHMSMIGIRDLSIINTAPLDRVAIRTFIAEFDDRVIREVILREVQRGGQVYFVHNRVHNIDQTRVYLQALVPEARFAVAHGKMREMDLERVMVDFVDQKSDVLVCTSIIESGLDIPSVNTILINRADCFGLSQLYQLRGRVGRADRRAFAYLLIPGRYLINEQAQKRLEVLQKNTELGSGFRIASYDLEIRGAGNLLGGEQSGHVHAVGLELYAKLMKKAIQELKGERFEEEIDPEIDLRIPAYIPQEYIADDQLRLGLYKRLSMLDSEEEIEEMEIELKDRFGEVPRETKNLLQVIEIKALAKRACITKLAFGGAATTLSFDAKTPVEVEHLLHLVNTHKGWRITPDNRLVVASGGGEKPALPENVIPIDREARILTDTRRLLQKLLSPSGTGS